MNWEDRNERGRELAKHARLYSDLLKALKKDRAFNSSALQGLFSAEVTP